MKFDLKTYGSATRLLAGRTIKVKARKKFPVILSSAESLLNDNNMVVWSIESADNVAIVSQLCFGARKGIVINKI